MPDEKTRASLRVFISYTHDSIAHKRRVLALANRLRDHGIQAELDQYLDTTSPPEGWPRWMDRQLRESDYIVVVCSERYRRRAEGTEKLGEGQGGRWEAHLTYQHLYDAGAHNTRFIPVLLEDAETDCIPTPLRGATHYRLRTPYDIGEKHLGYEMLYRRLTSQPVTRRPPTAPGILSLGSQPSPSGVEPIRSYLYVSDAKIEMLYQQLPRDDATGPNDTFARLRSVEGFLAEHGHVGPLGLTSEYCRDVALASFGVHGGLMFLYNDSMLLVGSAVHMIGARTSPPEVSGSHLGAAFAVYEELFGAEFGPEFAIRQSDPARRKSLSRKLKNTLYDFDMDRSALARCPKIEVAFLAKRLATVGPTFLLASPLYVSYQN